MKLCDNTVSYIEKVLAAASLVNIDNIIVSTEGIRGIDDDRMVLICHTSNIPDLEFGSIGINGKVLTSRLNVVKGGDKFEITATMDANDEFARALKLKCKRTQVDYRCANPTVISAPKQINDTLMYRITFDNESLDMLSKGKTAMGADKVAIVSDRDGVGFEIADVNDDKLSFSVADSVTNYKDAEDTNPLFINRYPIAILAALMKQGLASGTDYFEIGQKGILKINVNKLDFYVLPRA